MARLIHFTYDSPANPWIGGGGATRNHEIYKRMAANHQITVFCGKYDSATESRIDGITYRFFGSKRSYLLSRITFSLATLAVSLTGFLSLRKYDLVIADLDAYTPFLPVLQRSKTVLMIYHLYKKDNIAKFGVPGYLLYFYESVAPRLYRHAIFIADSIRNQITLRNLHSVVIHTGIDDDLPRLPVEEHNYILSIGRIDIYHKGLDLLVQAFEKLHQDRPDLKLIMAGDGKDMPALVSLIAARKLEGTIELPGRVSEAGKRDLLRKCLFACMPSRYEGWGIVAIEAAACAKAVVGTDIDGLRDSIIAGKTGLLSQKDDAHDLYLKMLELCNNPTLRHDLGKNGREHSKNFYWDAISTEQEKFFSHIIAEQSRT